MATINNNLWLLRSNRGCWKGVDVDSTININGAFYKIVQINDFGHNVSQALEEFRDVLCDTTITLDFAEVKLFGVSVFYLEIEAM